MFRRYAKITQTSFFDSTQKLPRLRFSTPRKNYPDFVFRLHAKITQTLFSDSTQKLPRLRFRLKTTKSNQPI